MARTVCQPKRRNFAVLAVFTVGGLFLTTASVRAAEMRVAPLGDKAIRALSLTCEENAACGGDVALAFGDDVRLVTVDAVIAADTAYLKFRMDDGPLTIGTAGRDFIAIPLRKPGMAHEHVEVMHPTLGGLEKQRDLRKEPVIRLTPRMALVDIDIDTTR